MRLAFLFAAAFVCSSVSAQEPPIDVVGGSVVLYEDTNTLALTIKVAGDLESGGRPSFGWDILCPEIPWSNCGTFSSVFAISTPPDWLSTGLVGASDYRGPIGSPNRTIGEFPYESYETTVMKFGEPIDVTVYRVDLPADLMNLGRTDYRFNAWVYSDALPAGSEGFGTMQVNVPEPSTLALAVGTILLAIPRVRRHLRHRRRPSP